MNLHFFFNLRDKKNSINAVRRSEIRLNVIFYFEAMHFIKQKIKTHLQNIRADIYNSLPDT